MRRTGPDTSLIFAEEGAITITIQLGAMPNMLGEIAEQMLSAFPALRVVGRPPVPEGPVAAARRTGAKLVIVCDDDEALKPLDEIADLAVFALAANGRSGALLTLQRQEIALDAPGVARLERLLASKGARC